MKVISPSFYYIFLIAILFSKVCFSKTYEIYSQHSFLKFEIGFMNVSTVEGVFKNWRGSFDYDESVTLNIPAQDQSFTLLDCEGSEAHD